MIFKIEALLIVDMYCCSCYNVALYFFLLGGGINPQILKFGEGYIIAASIAGEGIHKARKCLQVQQAVKGSDFQRVIIT